MFRYGMDMNTPSNADYALHMLKEQEAIQLYPKEEPLTESEQYIKDMQALYESTQAGVEEHKQNLRNRFSFQEDVKSQLLAAGLYRTFVLPVLQEHLATTREMDVAMNVISDMIQEEGTDDLLYKMRYKNLYLAEVAHEVDKAYEAFTEGMEDKIKEGLSEKDICDIEDKDIQKYLDDCDKHINKDITDTIFRRVEGAVTDFIDDKKKTQFKIKQIYDDAKKKIEEYNQASSAVAAVQQTDGDSIDGMDPDAEGVDNFNAKMDAQQNMDVANTAGAEMTPAQEAVAWAKRQESDLLDEHYNVFDAMVRIMVESVHRNDKIKSQYVNESNKLDFQKIVNDTRGMYTVLEAFNTVGLIDANEEYLRNMIHEMYEGIQTSI